MFRGNSVTSPHLVTMVTVLQIAVNPVYRMGAFQHHFVKNPGLKQYKGGSYDLMLPLDGKVEWEVRKKLSWAFSKDAVSSLGFLSYNHITMYKMQLFYYKF